MDGLAAVCGHKRRVASYGVILYRDIEVISMKYSDARCLRACADSECVPGRGLAVSVPGVRGEEPGRAPQRHHLQRPPQPADGRAGGILPLLPAAGHRRA